MRDSKSNNPCSEYNNMSPRHLSWYVQGEVQVTGVAEVQERSKERGSGTRVGVCG
jgi:hypothetical protein